MAEVEEAATLWSPETMPASVRWLSADQEQASSKGHGAPEPAKDDSDPAPPAESDVPLHPAHLDWLRSLASSSSELAETPTEFSAIGVAPEEPPFTWKDTCPPAHQQWHPYHDAYAQIPWTDAPPGLFLPSVEDPERKQKAKKREAKASRDNTSWQEGYGASGEVRFAASLQVAAPVELAAFELENLDGESTRTFINHVVSSTSQLAWTQKGSRMVQKAIDIGSVEDQQRICDQLRGSVIDVIMSPHANRVLQKCIETMHCYSLTFVIAEIQGQISWTAKNQFGCRILQRLIEYCKAWQTEHLVLELLSDSTRLCKHQYGNFVIQHILQHGAPAHRSAIARVLCQDAIRMARHRMSTFVISCALVHCATEDVKMLIQVLRQDAAEFFALSKHLYGSFVVREVNKAAGLLDLQDNASLRATLAPCPSANASATTYTST